MKQNNFLKKALTLVGAAVIAGAVGLGAIAGSQVSADTDAPNTQKIMITKYATDDTVGQMGTDQTPNADKATVENAGFKVYDITDQYWDMVNSDKISGDSNALSSAVSEIANGQNADGLTFELTKQVGDEHVTDANGQVNFELPTVSGSHSAVYEFVESTTPGNYNPSVNFVVSLPAKTGDNGFVNVYPKDTIKDNYEIKFTKVDANNQKTPLAGAVFKITNADKTMFAKVLDKDGKKIDLEGFSDDVQSVVWVEDEADASTFTTKEDGEFGFAANPEQTLKGQLYGLNAKKVYDVTEVKAPKGYQDDYKVIDKGKTNATAKSSKGYTVTDTPKGILPHTGGAGIIAIVAAGLAITVIGVAAYSKRRANA